MIRTLTRWAAASSLTLAALLLTGCAAEPAAESGSEANAQEDVKSPGIADSALASAKETLMGQPQTGTTPEGYELGNLSEHGATELLNEVEWTNALEASKDHPVLLFKHSTACPISGAAYRRTGAYLDEKGEEAPEVYLVKVIEHRPVSLKIEEALGVKHESPQAILLKDGKAVWDTSHEDITAETLETALGGISNP